MGYKDICLFAETVTWGTENCLLKKCNMKNPNYDHDQNCLHKNLTQFPDFAVTFFQVIFCVF